MKTLDDLDLTENTFIVYTSDNGPWLSKKHHGGSALPLRAGKATTYEGGMRVPCVMRWPARIKPVQVCNQVAATIDLLPTFARIAGATLDASRTSPFGERPFATTSRLAAESRSTPLATASRATTGFEPTSMIPVQVSSNVAPPST